MSNIGKVITCKAAITYGPGEPLVIEEIQVEPPQAFEIRVKITHTSLCHTDIHYWDSKDAGPILFPCIFGHEAAGIVESIGELIIDFQVGDHVLPLLVRECMECENCKSRKTNICQNFSTNICLGVMSCDQRTRFSKDGKPIFHFFGTSTFSEYTIIEHGRLVKVDPLAPLDKICLLSCGVSTGLGAAWNTAKVEAGSTVAIFGLGTVGLAVAEGARVAGASKIIGVDLNNEKSGKAKTFGITDFLNPSEYDKPISQVIMEMTGGGVDYSFECVGNTNLMHTAFDSCHKGYGVCVLCGLVTDPAKVFSTHPLSFLGGRSLTGTLFGHFKGVTEIPSLVEKYMHKGFQLDEFVTHELPFSKINEAFHLMLDGKSLRCVLHVGNT
ncbi:hypothetical protein O6H91_02G085400 [Diphasiastrum complanatum]|uniref:Uncharacterized protein n=1 Tax=Diphasiastrum complanatum TaxID=34168 RepID=A0ACC2EHI6_DIPCM|nr:hypothetical protein O6H91_02G085400 [Diphasiastrum complanatum]